MSTIAKLQDDLTRLLLGLACVAALLMAFGPPAAADPPRKLDPFESGYIDDIGEFRPDVAKKVRRALKNRPLAGRASTEYLLARVRGLDSEILNIKEAGNEKQLQNAIFARAILWSFVNNLTAFRPDVKAVYKKEWSKKTTEEKDEIGKERILAKEELVKIREARRKAAEETRQMKDVCAYVKQGPLAGWDNARQGCYGNWYALFCHTLFDGPSAAHRSIKCGTTLFESEKVNAGPGSTTWDFCALVPASLKDECYGHAALMKRLCTRGSADEYRDEQRACIAATKDMPASAKLDANAE